eukprot:RCo029907
MDSLSTVHFCCLLALITPSSTSSRKVTSSPQGRKGRTASSASLWVSSVAPQEVGPRPRLPSTVLVKSAYLFRRRSSQDASRFSQSLMLTSSRPTFEPSALMPLRSSGTTAAEASACSCSFCSRSSKDFWRCLEVAAGRCGEHGLAGLPAPPAGVGDEETLVPVRGPVLAPRGRAMESLRLPIDGVAQVESERWERIKEPTRTAEVRHISSPSDSSLLVWLIASTFRASEGSTGRSGGGGGTSMGSSAGTGLRLSAASHILNSLRTASSAGRWAGSSCQHNSSNDTRDCGQPSGRSPKLGRRGTAEGLLARSSQHTTPRLYTADCGENPLAASTSGAVYTAFAGAKRSSSRTAPGTAEGAEGWGTGQENCR